MCTSSIYHMYNGYYSEVIWPREPISTHDKDDIKPPKHTIEVLKHQYQRLSLNHLQLRHIWRSTRPMWGAMMKTAPIYFKRCASSCRPILDGTQGCGMTRITIPSWVQRITPKPYFVITKNWHHNAKHIYQLGQSCLSSVTLQAEARQYQNMMRDYLQMSRATVASK